MATVESSDLETIDLHDPAVFADGPPDELFAQMRAQAPVHRNPPSGDQDGFWSLTAYEDIVAVNKDWERFSSERRGSFLVEGGIVPRDFQKLLFNMMDPPGHDRHRGILQRVFTARAVAEREQDVRRVVNALIDDVIERGECDFVTDIAVELPLTVTANMLGVPHEDRAKLFHWTNQLADTSLTLEDKLQTIGEIGGYLVAFITALRERPTDDLLSHLVHAELDGERLNDAELMAHFIQLMNGGNETTRNAFAGGMLALIEHPLERVKLLDEPDLITGAVEEILRWHTPIMHQARTATRDVVIGGVRIAEDEKVVMWYPSANRDPALNDHPDRFDVARARPRHMSFGAGRHFCLGNQLARLELKVCVEETLRRLPDLELAGPVVKKPNNSFHWMVSMPVSFTAGRPDAPDG
ncbi:MAG: cytochrome P450 [Solirubrobacteraceae bacterium]